ncbi:putative transcriptional regulator [Methanocella conradii HZ254]|uniref:Transcriptional regulator n=1 Tax=Methanocella conradii (strain DSM 24694 / JCM 17849 / CGMCC 1.5162 / HZ254) TaxID=1041930 RepID=H8I9I1_METCZ|nr:CBS domain-containing protein [Methanocella conradii]AFD00026.1 putative transcriptional regulator [Methanocella conradii HZ254]
MYVSEITTDNFERIDIKANLQQVLPLFKNSNNPAVLVFDGKEYVGMVTEKSIVRSIHDLKTGISGLVRKTPKITPHTTICEAARLMVENQLKQLPVFDRKVIGVVTNENLMREATKTDFGSRPVSSIMSEDVISVDADDRVGKVINIFREEGISRVPVMSNGKLAGIVTMHDLLELIMPKKVGAGKDSIGANNSPMRNIKVKDIMTDSVLTVKPESTIREAVNLMLDHDVHSLVVFDEKVKGIITRTDVLLALAAMENENSNPNFTLQLTNGSLVDFDQDYVTTSIKNFIKKSERFLGRGTINVYFKQHKETFRGIPLVLCRVRLKTDRHYYNARGEGWGADGAFHIAMSTLERQVLNDKEMHEDRRYPEASIAEKLDIL